MVMLCITLSSLTHLLFIMLNILEVGLCAGRHEIKNEKGEVIDKYIFGHIENPLDFGALEGMADIFIEEHDLEGEDFIDVIKVYITGLTPALTSFLAVAKWRKDIKITLMHFNRDTGGYEAQYWFGWD